MEFSIFFAGTGGSIPTARRGLPSILVRRGGDRILVDCGEGTQRQLVSSVGLADLTEIFLTHFHADHWLGLPGMLKTFDLRGREAPLTISGPRGLHALMDLAMRMAGAVSFPLELVELEPCPSPIGAPRWAMRSTRTSAPASSTRTPRCASV
jgi:ribonuclease Z